MTGDSLQTLGDLPEHAVDCQGVCVGCAYRIKRRERERTVSYLREWAKGPTNTARAAVRDVAMRIEAGEHD